MAILLWLAIVPTLSVIVTAAVERTGGANDEANRDRQQLAQRMALAREAVQDARSEVETLVKKAADECSRATNPKADPRGARCLAAEGSTEKARERLDAARAKAVDAGVDPRDPLASRVAVVLPISEDAIRLYQPLMLPLSISVLGLLLIAYAAHRPQQQRARRVATGKRRRRKAKPRIKPAAQLAADPKVVPLRRG